MWFFGRKGGGASTGAQRRRLHRVDHGSHAVSAARRPSPRQPKNPTQATDNDEIAVSGSGPHRVKALDDVLGDLETCRGRRRGGVDDVHLGGSLTDEEVVD
jgi:hypothetical protein